VDAKFEVAVLDLWAAGVGGQIRCGVSGRWLGKLIWQGLPGSGFSVLSGGGSQTLPDLAVAVGS
jgi:hypothetical protein